MEGFGAEPAGSDRPSSRLEALKPPRLGGKEPTRLSGPPRRTTRSDSHHRLIFLFAPTLTIESRQFSQENFSMAYVITDACIKDALCVDVCPTDCIHPKTDESAFDAATQLFVDPAECIDCGACLPICTSESIMALDDVPEDKKDFIERNAAYYKD
jgi:ferredoxin